MERYHMLSLEAQKPSDMPPLETYSLVDVLPLDIRPNPNGHSTARGPQASQGTVGKDLRSIPCFSRRLTIELSQALVDHLLIRGSTTQPSWARLTTHLMLLRRVNYLTQLGLDRLSILHLLGRVNDLV